LAAIVAPGNHICVAVMGTANDMYRTAPSAVVSILFVLVFFVQPVVRIMLPQVNGRIACRS
jgi:hypothetical protein